MSDKRHRVAIVVFCEAEGGDAMDAALTAVRALKVALSEGDKGHPLVALPPVKYYRDGAEIASLTVKPVEVMEAGMAAGNGYLWTQPTSKAFRESALNGLVNP